MIGPVTLAYGLAVLGLLVGVGIVAAIAGDDSFSGHRQAVAALFVIPGFAALSYVFMALDVGTITVAGDTVYLPRYVDWLVTTPVLVGFVGYVAGAPRKWIGAVAAADALMILTGLVATLLAPPLKWVLFGVSALCHLALFAVVYRVFPRFATAGSDRYPLFKLLQNHIGLLWIAYPVVWLSSPAGLGLTAATGIALIVAYLDVVAKTPYVYFVWRNRTAFGGDGSGSATGESVTDAPAASGAD